MGVKRWRCTQFVNCKKSECGNCENCLDKKKFGGLDTRKKPCVMRTCLSMREINEPLVPQKQKVTKSRPTLSNVDLDEVKTEPQEDMNENSKKDATTLVEDDLVSKLRSLFDDPDDEAYWKEFCEAANEKTSIIDVRKVKEENTSNGSILSCQNCEVTYTNKRSLYHHTWRKHSRNKL